jgi:hypothetical protein
MVDFLWNLKIWIQVGSTIFCSQAAQCELTPNTMTGVRPLQGRNTTGFTWRNTLKTKPTLKVINSDSS